MKQTVLLAFLFVSWAALAQTDTLGVGWAKTSVNAVVFRKNSVVSFKGTQYASWYDTTGHVVLAMRKGKGKWTVNHTTLKGNVADAHNSISMMVDGEGYLHLAWDHHNNPINYARSQSPGSLDVKWLKSMVESYESKVTYPEFYRMPSGDLIFLYRNGESGRGNLIMNRFGLKTKRWTRIQDNLIDGEGERNAYWQAFVSADGTIHLSWVWRESPDVASNHDMCYARSKDGGKTWEKSTGEKYSLPIKAGNAEYAMMIPQQSELINQTSMSATKDGHPVIATYWRPDGTTIPQFFLIYNDGNGWHHEQVSERMTPFTLKGGSTKKIPVSRPQVMVSGNVSGMTATVVYRDDEREHMITVASRTIKGAWTFRDMLKNTPGIESAWEPTYDTELFKKTGKLVLFVQVVTQGDGEKVGTLGQSPVVLLQIN